jgi:hypothetical protein
MQSEIDSTGLKVNPIGLGAMLLSIAANKSSLAPFPYIILEETRPLYMCQGLVNSAGKAGHHPRTRLHSPSSSEEHRPKDAPVDQGAFSEQSLTPQGSLIWGNLGFGGSEATHSDFCRQTIRGILAKTYPAAHWARGEEEVTGGLAIRLSFDSADQLLVGNIVEALRSAGFQVLGFSTRGIDARASREVIERFFEVPVCDTGQPRFDGEPKFDRLPRGANYRAYFPRPPQLF